MSADASTAPRRLLVIKTGRISAADSTERQRGENVDDLFWVVGDA